MRIVTDLFSQILEMSLTASVVITAVFFIRCLMLKLPKKYSYCLWAVVLFRLISPVSVSSALSIFNLGGYQWKRFLGLTDAVVSEEKIMLPAETITTYTYAGDISESVTVHEYVPSTVDFAPTEMNAPIWLQISSLLWLVGIAAILFYSIYTYFRFCKVVTKATLLRENIYECENIPSPFVMGMFTPKIYIPYHLSGEEQNYVLAHEKYHIKRCDHIVKIVAFMVLAVYWFHPLVWTAFFFASRDMEMSCDEKVLSMFGGEIKQDYSRLLLSFATNKRMRFAGPLAFGESDTGRRVKNVLRFHKPHMWGSVLGIALLAVVVLGCATDEAKSDVVEVGTGIAESAEEVTHHYYPNKIESADPEELSFIQDWAVAFCDRNGKAIYEMAAEESREMLAETLLLEEHNGEYSFGWSSPWPWDAGTDWKITEIENGKAVILYYACTSDPHVMVWRSEVSYEKVDGRYQCIPEEIQFMDSIDSIEDFYKAYPYAVIRDTQMDYLTNGMGEALYKNAEENRASMPDYEKLFEPDTAAKYLLNLSDNVNAYAKTHVDADGEDAAYVRLLFPDGYMTMIQMVCPFGTDGIWIPQAYLTEEEMETILQEPVEGELIYLEEEVSENLLPHQSAPAPDRVYSIYNYFDNPHEGGLESGTVDLNGDGTLEEISVERLSNNGGDGGYIVHVKNAETGEEIPLPEEIAGEQYPFSTIWNEDGLQVLFNGICIARYKTDFIYEIYEKKAIILSEHALDTEQTISGDAASGYSVYEDAEGTQLIIKYYLSGLEGHVDCFGYGLVHLKLLEDNTWEMRISFAVDLATEG